MSSWRRSAVAAALVVIAAACRAGPSAPPPVPTPSSKAPVEERRFTRGEARVHVSGAVHASFQVPLAPSTLYPSSPAKLILSWGDPRSEEGLDLQIPPVTGSTTTSEDEILVITVPSGERQVQAASLEGECTVSLTLASAGDVRGSFRCRRVATGLGSTSRIDASGTFTATG